MEEIETFNVFNQQIPTREEFQILVISFNVENLIKTKRTILILIKKTLISNRVTLEDLQLIKKNLNPTDQDSFTRNLLFQIRGISILKGFLDSEEFKTQIQEILDSLKSHSHGITLNQMQISTNSQGIPVNQMQNMGINSNQLSQISITEKLKMLVEIVNQINPESSTVKTFSRHRKVAVSFRDLFLLQIVESSLLVYSQNINVQNNDRGGLVETAIELINSCLNFDFLGYLVALHL